MIFVVLNESGNKIDLNINIFEFLFYFNDQMRMFIDFSIIKLCFMFLI